MSQSLRGGACLLLSLLALAGCRGQETEALHSLSSPSLDVTIANTPQKLSEWELQPNTDTTLRLDAHWPPLTEQHGIQAPEGEAFLWVLPLPSTQDEASFLAATIPNSAQKSGLYESFAVSQPPTWSLLYYPSHDALSAGEDSDIQRIDELVHLRLPARPAGDERTSFTPFYVELSQERLVKVCVPRVAPKTWSPKPNAPAQNRCEFYLWESNRGLQSLPLSLQGERRFEEPPLRPFETTIEGFFLNEDGRLHASLRVPLPPYEAHPDTLQLAIAWETSPLQTQAWTQTQLYQELQAWLGLPLDQSDEAQALYAAGRLLALRYLASNVMETKDAYLAFEANVLIQIAAIAERHWGVWDAWAWLAQLNDLLDQHADHALARPNASLMLLPEDAEKPSLSWRGEGQLLDHALPAVWRSTDSGPLLQIPRTAGLRYCGPTSCRRTLSAAQGDAEPPLEAPEDFSSTPSLLHPNAPVQLVDIWPSDRGEWSLVFTTTERQQRCEANDLCAGTCDAVSFARLSRLSKFQGRSYTRISLASADGPPRAQGAISARGAAPACAANVRGLEKPQPLFWLDDDRLLFRDADGLYQTSVSERMWRRFDEQDLSEAQKAIAGIDRDGNPYILRHLANELSVWRRNGETLELLALPNLRHPEAPRSTHGWVLPNPKGSELAVVFGGQLLGVWELSPAPSEAEARGEPK